MKTDVPLRIGLDATDHRQFSDLSRRGARELKIPLHICEAIRALRHRGLTVPDASEELGIDVSRVTVSQHAAGDCGHMDRVPPAPSKGKVTWVRCRAIRWQRSRGLSLATIASQTPFSVSTTTVGEHARGDCPHSFDEFEAVQTETVSLKLCEQWREEAVEKSLVTIAQNAEFTRQCVHQHVSGECAHDRALLPEGNLDRRACCREWRERVVGGESVESVSASVGLSKNLVKRHITGACEHGFDIPEQPPLRYNGETWVSAAELWGGLSR